MVNDIPSKNFKTQSLHVLHICMTVFEIFMYTKYCKVDCWFYTVHYHKYPSQLFSDPAKAMSESLMPMALVWLYMGRYSYCIHVSHI